MKTSFYTTDSLGNKIYIAILDDYSSVTFNYSALIANKQYSPLYEDTFDNLTDEEIKAQMDLWVNNNTLPNDIMPVGFNKRVRAVGKNLFDKSLYATSYAYKIKVKPSTAYVWSASTLYKTYNINQVEVASGTNTTITTGANVYYIAFSDIASIDTFQLELGLTATTYEEYTHNDLYIKGGNGYKLPNGVKDEVITRDGKLISPKKIKRDDVVGVVAVNTTNYTDAKNGGKFINYLASGTVEIGVIGTDSKSGDGTIFYELANHIETEVLSNGI